MAKRPSFRIDTTHIITLWAQCLQDDMSWCDWIAKVVSRDDRISEDNPDAFHETDGHPTYIKDLAWAEREFPGKSKAHKSNQARLKFLSDRVSSKINNIRPKMKRSDGSVPNRPHGYSERWGVKKKGAAPLDWTALGNLFHADDFKADD